jgi:uncharacterized protein (TIGR00369 family)
MQPSSLPEDLDSADQPADIADAVERDDRVARLRARFRDIWQNDIPFNAALGLTITRWEPDGARLELPLAAWLLNGVGTVHGGVIAALADTAAGAAIMAGNDYAAKQSPSTVSITVHYLNAASGTRLVADATCTKRGKRVLHCNVHISDDHGRVIADAIVSSTMI